MPNYRRPKRPGATIYFTVCLAQRGSTLLTDQISVLREAVAQTRASKPFCIDAWVVLPDHMHAIWTLPDADTAYAHRWGAIKARFSKRLLAAGCAPTVPGFGPRGGVNPALRKGESGIWQKRFWEHHIRGRDDYQMLLRHCHQNPVRHGLVERAQDWPYSSIHRDVRAGRLVL